MTTDLRGQLQGALGSSYTLERELGGGGMSRVFVAEETSLRRKVVVKVLPPELTAGVNVDRFKREIQVAARLQHAHIVPVLTAGEMDGIPYYTMPFVEGESLRARIARTGPLPITEAIGMLRDVAKALAYAHGHGVVHRDIKPDNTMLGGGSASVVDFGIAKAISAARTGAPGATITQIGTSIGTPAYMAPEQAAGDPATDFRADLYSFGCMAYEALAARPPFVATSPHKLMAAHMSETPQRVETLRPDVPESLAALIHRCLEKDPDKRPESAGDIARQLDSITSSGGLAAMPPILIGGQGMLKKALLLYATAFVAVAIVAKAAVVGIGLPEWVLPGSLVVMALGLPVILFTGYVHHTTRKLVNTTPQLTPGGSPSMPQGTMQTLAIKASPHLSWRRATLGGAYALGAFIALVGAFMVLRSLGIGPFGSLLAMGRMNNRETLVVADFKVTSADTTLGRVLSDAAKTQLAQSSVITLLPPVGVAEALRRMERPVNSVLDFALARELALRNGIKAIVDGEITGLGPAGFIITMKLVTTDSVRELASFRQTTSDAQGLIAAVDQLSRQLRGRIGESLRRVNSTPPLARVQTGSLDALRKYSEGAREEDLYGRRDRAIALLREAVAIDSNFAEAWRKLGMIASNMGRGPLRDSALTRAFQLRNSVPEAQRHWIDAGYYQNGPPRDRARAAEVYERALRDGDSGVDNNLALLLTSRREFARAESLFMARHRRAPGSFRPMYGTLLATQQAAGRLDAADSTIDAREKLFPEMTVVTRRARHDMLWLRGDSAAYRRVVDSVFTRGDSAERAWARPRVLQLALLDGRLSRWEALREEARPASATPRQQFDLAVHTVTAWTTAKWRRRPELVERRVDAAVAGMKTLEPMDYHLAARAYVVAERPSKARQMMARFDAEVRDTTTRRVLRPEVDQTLSDILLAEGKGLEAADAARRADRLPDGPRNPCQFCLPSSLAQAYDRAGVADSAIHYYERYLAMPGWNRIVLDQIVVASFNRRLGELYEQRGDRERAARYYLAFVNLWKNADPELQPHVAEIRRRLSRLADVESARR